VCGWVIGVRMGRGRGVGGSGWWGVVLCGCGGGVVGALGCVGLVLVGGF